MAAIDWITLETIFFMISLKPNWLIMTHYKIKTYSNGDYVKEEFKLDTIKFHPMADYK